MMALMWAFIYRTLEMVHPGSFCISQSLFDEHSLVFVYYSFVTITTFGFGDISPATNLAGSLSVSEAVTGQLCLVVQVAWLVGVHVPQSMEKGSV